MHVLVTWGSKRGGTEGIARMLGEALQHEGLEVQVLPADEARTARRFGAVIVGGALYANRWHRAARRFVTSGTAELRRVPVWFFSSGPLDDSASRETIPPPRQVRVLMERVGAQGHVTFGGRLARDAQGFIARSMAKTMAGDFRDRERIRAWASEIARALPTARPAGVAEEARSGSVARVVTHAVAGWVLCGATLSALLAATSLGTALVLHALVVPLVFVAVAASYYRRPAALAPFPTALVFAALLALLDLVLVAGLIEHDLAVFRSIARSWLPLFLVFAATWWTGARLVQRRPAARGWTLLDAALPEFEFCGRIAVPVRASSLELFRAFREVTLADIPLARALGKLRYLPGRLLGRRPPDPPATEPFVDQLLAGGNVVLAERSDELVLGAIGKYHQLLDQEPVVLRTARAFRELDDPSFQKLVMGVRGEEGPGGRQLVLEHRTHALGAASRSAFARYWVLIEPGSYFVTWLLLRAVSRRAEHHHASRPTQSLPHATG